MIRIRACEVALGTRDDLVYGGDSFHRSRGNYKARLDLEMDQDGYERLRAVLAMEFGATMPPRPDEEERRREDGPRLPPAPTPLALRQGPSCPTMLEGEVWVGETRPDLKRLAEAKDWRKP